MQKKLYKSATDRKICGVCGGIAEYLTAEDDEKNGCVSVISYHSRFFFILCCPIRPDYIQDFLFVVNLLIWYNAITVSQIR